MKHQKSESLKRAPRSMSQNSLLGKTSTEIEHRGLINQAMTCYLNSMLQALYMTPEFRNAIYHWEFDDNANIDKSKSFAFQLQKLFLNLQTSPRRSVETTDLTHCFGWDSNEKCVPHDIQECCTNIFNILEEEFKNTINNDLLNQLFQGFYIDYCKCQECGFEKHKETPFLDISLPIRPFGSTNAYGSLTEALQGFIEPELLDGNNKYFCGSCKKECSAQKSLKFIKLPYIINFQLKRVDINPINSVLIKLSDKVTFPLKLNLNSFISNHKNKPYKEELFRSGSKCDENSSTGKNSFSETIKINQNENIDANRNIHMIENKHEVYLNPENEPVGPYMYELYAIMIHSGSVANGHYFAYIKDFKTEKWLCFNDEFVSEITIHDIEKSFGIDAKRNTSITAYMLMYRQIDKNRNKIAMSQDEFPPHLKNLHNIKEVVSEKNNQMREKECNMFKVIVMYIGKYGWLNEEFDCNIFTTVNQLKTMAIQCFKVNTPCQLVIFNKTNQTICENLEDKSNSIVCHLNYTSPFGFLLQTVDTEYSGSQIAASKYDPMTLCMITMDNIQYILDNMLTNDYMNLKVQGNKKIGNMITKYNISDESKPKNLEILDKTVKCKTVYPNVVYVLTQCHYIHQTDFMVDVKNGSIPDENKIYIQFRIMSSDDTVDSDLSTKDWDVNPQDLCAVVIDDSGDQSEDNILERTIITDSTGDNEMLSSVFDDYPMEVFDYDELNEHIDMIVDDNIDNELQFDKNCDFQVISLKAAGNYNGRLHAFVDKRLTIKQLKNHLEAYIRISPDYFILFKLNSDNELEEIDSSSGTMENLNLFNPIEMSSSVALNDSQYYGIVFCMVSQDPTQIVLAKLIDWIITVGTSVLDTKKELLAKLNESLNSNIPLERISLCEKKEDTIIRYYCNEEIWTEDIGQGWEMVILVFTDSSDLELDKLKD